MKISIAMATYNGEKFIENQLLSIYNQTRQPDEVIISDDGSVDNTVQIITDFIVKYKLETWQLYINNSNSIECSIYERVALNFIEAAKKTSGDIIFFSDQDDIWHSQKIEVMADLMETNPQIYNLLCNKSFINQKGEVINPVVRRGFKKRSLTKVSMFSKFNGKSVPGMCMVIRRCVLDYILQHSNLDYPNHDHVCAYIASAMDGFYFYNESLTHHRRHETNISGARLKRNRSHAEKADGLQQNLDTAVIALRILKDISNKEEFINEKKYAETRVKIHKLRIENFQNRNAFATLLTLRYVTKYISWRAYIGDIVFVLGL